MDRAQQNTVTVHALDAGHLTLPERFFITPADPEARHLTPSLCFLIQHHDRSNGKITRIVLDLGIRRDLMLYPKSLHKHCASRSPMTGQPDVVASLARGDISVDDIDYIIFSHVHYDHVGMPSDFSNPKTTFIVGNGALDLLAGKSVFDIGGHMVFEPDLLEPERTVELPSPAASGTESMDATPSKLGGSLKWQSLRPFPAVIDFFGDGSMYIVDAPGHLPGHTNLLCRISSEDQSPGAVDKFVYLAGDACHDYRLLAGDRDIATWVDERGKTCCIHVDIPTAMKTLERMREVLKNGIQIGHGDHVRKGDVEIVFAHDWAWEADAIKRGRFWPGRL